MGQSNSYKIAVDVETVFVEGQSNLVAARYVFAYTITIHNQGAIAAKLLTRHWIITDGEGKVHEICGQGVIGEQPYLRPGEQFRYTSGAMIETPVGSMQGHYGMLAEDGIAFDAEISAFTLAMPGCLH